MFLDEVITSTLHLIKQSFQWFRAGYDCFVVGLLLPHHQLLAIIGVPLESQDITDPLCGVVGDEHGPRHEVRVRDMKERKKKFFRPGVPALGPFCFGRHGVDGFNPALCI